MFDNTYDELSRFNDIANQESASEQIIIATPQDSNNEAKRVMVEVRECLNRAEEIALKSVGTHPVFEIIKNRIKSSKEVLDDAFIKISSSQHNGEDDAL